MLMTLTEFKASPHILDEVVRKSAIAIAAVIDLYIYKLISVRACAVANVIYSGNIETASMFSTELSTRVTVLRKADVPARFSKMGCITTG